MPVLALLLGGLLLQALIAGAAAAGDIEAGRRLYLEGVLASGQPVEAGVQPGLVLRGPRAACVQCHRRSGFGSSEGNTQVRPITGPYLFEPDNAHRLRIYRNIGKGRDTPVAYDDASLAQAVRQGIAPGGRTLGGLMPRYPLDEADMGNLAAYLRTLSATPSPGVDATELHFATVIDEAADPAQSAALQEVMEAFFKVKNAGTRHEKRRYERAPWHMERMFKAYRQWRLHVWRLHGPPATWPGQLEAYYRKQPVFAVLGGIGTGDWQPVHDFCQRSELPCLFPNIAAPPMGKEDFYSLYFSRGANTEAEALAIRLGGQAGQRIVQVRRQGDEIAAAAARTLAGRLAGKQTLVDVPVPAEAAIDARYWQDMAAREHPDALVLWLKAPDLAALAAPAAGQGATAVYLSASLAGPMPPAGGLAAQAYLAYPFDLPERLDQRLQRLRAWLRGQGIPAREEAIQANTFFALNQAGDALMHMVENFSREYFIELIEHGIENSPAPSIYPSHSLGPDQRYASKGAYIVKLDPNAPGGIRPVSDWIVP